MKRIGLLGGMSWESSVEYERIINEAVRERLGGTHSADLIIRSYDFAAIEALQEAGDWERAGELLASDARVLEEAGAELLVLCTNTMHKLADRISDAVSIPFLHIADATHDAISRSDVDTVALLGTRYTMEQRFYRDRIETLGTKVLIPDEPDRSMIHDVIFEELVLGVVSPQSKAAYLHAVKRLIEQGAQGVIAGCTEIEMLIGPDDVDVPFFATASIHALAAVEASFS
jgi:aspartate racemase